MKVTVDAAGIYILGLDGPFDLVDVIQRLEQARLNVEFGRVPEVTIEFEVIEENDEDQTAA